MKVKHMVREVVLKVPHGVITRTLVNNCWLIYMKRDSCQGDPLQYQFLSSIMICHYMINVCFAFPLKMGAVDCRGLTQMQFLARR